MQRIGSYFSLIAVLLIRSVATAAERVNIKAFPRTRFLKELDDSGLVAQLYKK